MDPFTYLIPSLLNQEKVQKKLPAIRHYQLALDSGEKQKGLLLDTFDAKLRQSNQLLFQAGTMLSLYELKTGQMFEQTASEDWAFPADLEPGPVSSRLLQVSRLRAFLPVAGVTFSLGHGSLLDDEGKTRVRLVHLFISCRQRSVGIGCTQYLRGYDQAHEDLRLALEETGAVFCRDVGVVFDVLGIKQEIYTAKPKVALNPDAPVKQSARKIIRSFLRIARRNEKGLVADYDTEFLHDYRVSLRKVRSVLSLFKGVFSPEQTDQLKKNFASLMQKTNALRDLDVYLLNRSQYFDLVPADTHEGLEILFRYFEGERQKEQKQVSRVLKSKEYQNEIDRLKKMFADGSSLPSGPRGEEKSFEFACGLVKKRYDKVCKIARAIDDQSEDSVVHRLRIQCKKLRYLLEFFAPLFPEDESKSLIIALKQLQDNLGNFNDYSVQQRFLRQVLNNTIPDFNGREIKVAESIGALTTMLHRLQWKERRQVMKNFARFDSPEVHTIVTKLFNIEGSENENNCLL